MEENEIIPMVLIGLFLLPLVFIFLGASGAALVWAIAMVRDAWIEMIRNR